MCIRDSGQTAWKAGGDGTIVTVRRIMQKNNILVTRRSYEVTGGLFDDMPVKKGNAQVPLKGSDSRLNKMCIRDSTCSADRIAVW